MLLHGVNSRLEYTAEVQEEKKMVFIIATWTI